MFTCDESWALQRRAEDVGAVVVPVVVVRHDDPLEEPVVERRDLEVVLDDEGELVVGAGPPRLDPLRLEPRVGRAVVDALLPVRPAEGVERVEDLVGRGEGRVGRAVVEEDVQRDAVAVVVGGGQGAEAAEERGGAVVGEELDEEREAAGIRSRAGGGERRRRVGGAAEEEEGGEGDGEEEEEEGQREGAAARQRHWVWERRRGSGGGELEIAGVEREKAVGRGVK